MADAIATLEHLNFLILLLRKNKYFLLNEKQCPTSWEAPIEKTVWMAIQTNIEIRITRISTSTRVILLRKKITKTFAKIFAKIDLITKSSENYSPKSTI